MKVYEITESKQHLNEDVLTEGFWDALKLLGKGALSGPAAAVQFALSPTKMGDGTLHSWHQIPTEQYQPFVDALETGDFATATRIYRNAVPEFDSYAQQILGNDIRWVADQMGIPVDVDAILRGGPVRQAATAVADRTKEVAADVKNLIQDPTPITSIGNSAQRTAQDIATRLDTATGGKLTGPMALKVANAVKKYALPAAAILALLYGGKKLYDYMQKNKSRKAATETYKQKAGDYARHGGPMPKKKKRGPHPLGGKLVG